MASKPATAETALHPLGSVIAAVIEDGPDNTAVLSDEGLDFVRRALDEYLETGEALMAAVDTLLVAAHVIEIEQGSRSVAERLVTLVDRPEVIISLRRVTEAAEAARAQEVAQSAERFTRFRGESGPATTAAPDPTAPDGEARKKHRSALRLGDLGFPKRL